MGLKDTGRVNNESDAGAGRGRTINRDPGDKGPVNRNATVGTRGYEPVRLGSRAMAEPTRYSSTEVKVTLTPDPVRGGDGGTCTNLTLSAIPSPTVEDQVNLLRSAGQIGEVIYEEQDFGNIEDFYGKYLIAKFELVEDTVTETLNFETTIPTSSDTVKYVLLWTIGDAGELTRGSCNAYVAVCRNWYAAAEPFYTMTISYG